MRDTDLILTLEGLVFFFEMMESLGPMTKERLVQAENEIFAKPGENTSKIPAVLACEI